MQTTGFRTFVYSFCISLLVIFTANRAYWHVYSSNKEPLKIPSKNITLFLRGEKFNPSKSSAPVKKITLNLLPEIKKEDVVQKVVYEPKEEIILADNTDTNDNFVFEFDLDNRAENADEKFPAKIDLTETGKTELLKEVLDFEHLKNKSEQSEDNPKSQGIRLAAIPIEKGSANVSEEITKTLKTAKHEPQHLFPLEKGDVSFNKKNEIRTETSKDSNKVALADKNIPIISMEQPFSKTRINDNKNSKTSWENMKDKQPDAENPWVVAKGAAKPKNEMVMMQEYYKKEEQEINKALNPEKKRNGEVKFAAGTVKNLLIPIPEEILNEDDLTPQLSYSPKEETKKDISSVQASVKEESKDKNNILSSLNNIFSTKLPQTERQTKKTKEISDKQPKKNLNKRIGKIMPTEMRLSFQPNRAEISGQTLRWIQAFATKAANDQNTAIEIRIDGTSSMKLQQKRLNLLHNILTNKGVEYSKINTVFTNREPNSFIIRTITLSSFNQGNTVKTNNLNQSYYLQW